jgi:BASS family bile acid:Na+ symporter
MTDGLTRLFPIWALLATALALLFPVPWLAFDSWIVPLLMLIMFGMGMTLTLADFRRIAERPRVVAIGVVLQFLLMPLAALLVATVLPIQQELWVGLLIVGACPGGTASNVICYLARADVALSVTMTLVSTLAAVVVTPLLVDLYLGATIPVPVAAMLVSLVQVVLLPVVAGTILNTWLGHRLEGARRFFPLLSVIAIAVVIGIIVALNREHVLAGGLLVMAAVMAHNLLGLALGYGGGRLLRLPKAQARTLAIEVGMQNSGLGATLAAQHFSTLAALPGALFSIWHNLSGAGLAWYWRRKDAVDSTVGP